MSEPIPCGTISSPASSGVAPPDRLPVQREQEEHPEHERAERRGHRRARAESAVGEQAEVQERIAAESPGVQDERRHERDARHERADRRRTGAAARGRAREPVGQEGESGRQQQQAADVQSPARQALLVRHDPQPEHERDEAERHVDEEEPPPGHLADQQPAQDRPERRAAEVHERDDRQHLADPPRVDRRTTIACATGRTSPPPSPCRTRAAMSDSADQAIPHSTDPQRNAVSEPSQTRRVPKRSLAQPASGMTAVSDSR